MWKLSLDVENEPPVKIEIYRAMGIDKDSTYDFSLAYLFRFRNYNTNNIYLGFETITHQVHTKASRTRDVTLLI